MASDEELLCRLADLIFDLPTATWLEHLVRPYHARITARCNGNLRTWSAARWPAIVPRVHALREIGHINCLRFLRCKSNLHVKQCNTRSILPGVKSSTAPTTDHLFVLPTPVLNTHTNPANETRETCQNDNRQHVLILRSSQLLSIFSVLITQAQAQIRTHRLSPN